MGARGGCCNKLGGVRDLVHRKMGECRVDFLRGRGMLAEKRC